MITRQNEAEHYFEAHVTINPLEEHELLKGEEIASRNKFKLAKLLMQKVNDTGEPILFRSPLDTFLTAHSKDLAEIQHRVKGLVKDLKENKFIVRRYKIEDTVMDSRINDILKIL